MSIRTPFKANLLNLSASIILILYSCGHKQKGTITKIPSPKIIIPKAKLTKLVKDDFDSRADSLWVFDLDINETAQKDDTVGFVSVSEIDRFPGGINTPADSIDALVIPDQSHKKPADTRYFAIKSKFRKELLAGSNIKETDSLFVYNYAKNIFLSFPIKSLNAAASLSPYEDSDDVPHHATDYQIGFEINRNLLKSLDKGYYDNIVVYIGANNPFIMGKMEPVIWKKLDAEKFPSVTLKADEVTELKGFKLIGTYNFEQDGFNYYLQKYFKGQQPDRSTSLRLIVINPEKEIVYNNLYYESDGETPAEISFADSSKNGLAQWAGCLFKNRPPLIIGFEDLDFGCPILPYMDKSQKYVASMCDNRH
jgi:hypothetical protein